MLLGAPIPWHCPAAWETEAWRDWEGSAGLELHSQGCCMGKAGGEPLAPKLSLVTFGVVARQERCPGSCPVLAEPAPAFWLSPHREDGNANRNGEVLGEKMSTAPGPVPGSLLRGHCRASCPLPGELPPACPAPLGASTLRSRLLRR